MAFDAPVLLLIGVAVVLAVFFALPARIGEPGRMLDVLGLCLLVGAGITTLASLGDEISIYDEGILLTQSNLLLHGQLPHRDFYTNYPPGIYLLIAALWKLFGVSWAVPRLFGLFIHGAIALLAGGLAGRMSGRRFSLFAAGVILLWTSGIGVLPTASIVATATALGAIELSLVARERRALECLRCGPRVGQRGMFSSRLLCLSLASCNGARRLSAVAPALAAGPKAVRLDRRWGGTAARAHLDSNLRGGRNFARDSRPLFRSSAACGSYTCAAAAAFGATRAGCSAPLQIAGAAYGSAFGCGRALLCCCRRSCWCVALAAANETR